MLITPRPGVNRDNLVKSLQSVHDDVSSLSMDTGPTRNAYERLLAYLEWASKASGTLGSQISVADLNRLVLTDRYRLMFGGVVSMNVTELPVQRMLNGLVALELGQRVVDFAEAIKTLQSQILRWSGYEQFVMPDTGFYIKHVDKLENSDIPLLLGDPHSDFVVLVPMVVVDELDRLKEIKDKHVRWRAGYTLAVLDRLFSKREVSRAQLRHVETETEQGPLVAPLGKVWVELLFDSPGHIRLPIADDEIIDRALSVGPLADRPVTLLTYDTGQSMRARNAGLRAIKLSKEIGEEPA
jgi:hypothetical protein